MQWPAGGVYPWDAAQLGLTRWGVVLAMGACLLPQPHCCMLGTNLVLPYPVCRCSEPQARQAMQQACAERLTQSLEPSHLPQVCSNIDKIFCSVRVRVVLTTYYCP